MGFLCLPCFPVLVNARSRVNSISASSLDAEDYSERPQGQLNCCSPDNGHTNTVALTGLIILYLILGAAMFQILESEGEHQRRAELKTVLSTFLTNHQCFTSYGHVSPTTQAGKAFTIAYCILGIPITLALLSAFVERMKMPSTWLLLRMSQGMNQLCSVTAVQYLHLLILSSVIAILFFLIPSVIFANIEPHWSYLDAFYYCFISLTTIGLGDYIPGDQPTQQRRAFYKILTTGYLLAGLCGMMLFLTTLYDIPSLNIERMLGVEEIRNQEEAEKQYLGSQKTPFGPTYTKFDNKTGADLEAKKSESLPQSSAGVHNKELD